MEREIEAGAKSTEAWFATFSMTKLWSPETTIEYETRTPIFH